MQNTPEDSLLPPLPGCLAQLAPPEVAPGDARLNFARANDIWWWGGGRGGILTGP